MGIMDGLNKGALHPEPKKFKVPKGPKPIAHKNKNLIGLGRSIANKRRTENEVQILPDGEMRFTTDKREADWVKLRSVTQENALDEFLNTAEMADTDFTAEKHQLVKIIKVGNNTVVPQTGLLSPEEVLELRKKHQVFENKLTIPRRPKWNKSQLRIEIDRQENLAFLDWRRELAALTENNDLLLTPFERNLEVWKQLWRVVERCDLVVQIVDARAPLFFRSVDLDRYVNSLSTEELPKRNLLLVNKADLLTETQRKAWADYFNDVGINYVFFSAVRAAEQTEAELAAEAAAAERETDSDSEPEQDSDAVIEDSVHKDPTRILGVDELEALFLSESPRSPSDESKLQIGLVGYPNVGKSSTINALVGAKKVSVSATPGKTKHFQTIHLSPEVLLCDCPGLVFPNFAYTKGELVCNGVLPIDQLREHIPPVSLVCQRVPKFFLEAVYGIHIPIQKQEDGGNGTYPTARELLNAYARARGYMTQGFGSADEPRAARYILKDYITGKLLFVNPPPKKGTNGEWELALVEEGRDFNKELFTLDHLPESRQQQIETALSHKNMDVNEFDLSRDLAKLTFSMHSGGETGETKFYGGKQAALESAGDDLDREFFKMNNVNGKFSTPFHKLGSGSGSKKHGKKNKKAEKKKRVTGY